MLALATGWTPDVLAAMPARFRASCHWALYARTLSGPEGLPSSDIPSSLPWSQKIELQKRNVQVAKLRDILYPEDGE